VISAPPAASPKKLADRCRLHCTKNTRFLHRLSGTELHSNFNACRASFQAGFSIRLKASHSAHGNSGTVAWDIFGEFIAEFAKLVGMDQFDRSVVEHRPSKQRSRLTNGTGSILPDLDGRTAVARRVKDIVGLILADLGGADRCSETRVQLVRRFATVCVVAETMEGRLASGEDISIADHAVLCSVLVRLSQRIGLSRIPKTVPTLADYLATQNAARVVDSLAVERLSGSGAPAKPWRASEGPP
jgi:hypothetical protein